MQLYYVLVLTYRLPNWSFGVNALPYICCPDPRLDPGADFAGVLYVGTARLPQTEADRLEQKNNLAMKYVHSSW